LEVIFCILAIMGWDGFFVFDPRVDVVDMARAYMQVVQGESCGKCVPCRMGTRVAADILARIADGKGPEEDLDTLRRVGGLVREGCMCELGHISMNGVLALLDQFLARSTGTRTAIDPVSRIPEYSEVRPKMRKA
jgi:formate dehydrogenase beta subunit